MRKEHIFLNITLKLLPTAPEPICGQEAALNLLPVAVILKRVKLTSSTLSNCEA